MVKAIKIIHKKNQIKEYRFFSDFFQLIGIHVCNHTSKNEGVFSDFDSIIVLSRGMNQDELKKVQESFPKAIVKNPILKLDFDCLMSIVRDVSEQTAHFLEDDFPILCQIGEVYLRYDLSYHYSAYKNFHEHIDREVVQSAQDAFVDAYIDMGKILSDEMKSAYLYYAIAYLANCINETCYFLDEPLLLPVQNSLEFLDRAMEVEPVFDNAYLLKGILSELDDDSEKNAGFYYKIALEQLYHKVYANEAYYIVGRYYEKSEKDIGKAAKLYKQSLGLNNLDYKVIFRLAMIDKAKGDYTGALERLKMICNIFCNKEKENYLLPMEYEYLFRTYHEMCGIYGDQFFDLKKYGRSVQKRNDFSDMIGDLSKENCAYDEIYGEKSKEFRYKTYHRVCSVFR